VIPPGEDAAVYVIDARRVRDFGIGTYIRNLTRSLSALDADNQYTLIAHPNDAGEFAGLGPNFRIAPFEASDRGLKHNLSFPNFLKSLNASLYHIPLNSVAWAMPRPYVVTIHDLSSLLFPQRRDFRYTLHQQRYRRGVVRASRVIAVSNATRRDLEAILHLSDERLSTIFSASDPTRFQRARRSRPAAPDSDRHSVTYPKALYAERACRRKYRAWWKPLPSCATNWKITRYIRICGW
jgi:glycosyltransferase involved in cell wall biosynthesis